MSDPLDTVRVVKLALSQAYAYLRDTHPEVARSITQGEHALSALGADLERLRRALETEQRGHKACAERSLAKDAELGRLRRERDEQAAISQSASRATMVEVEARKAAEREAERAREALRLDNEDLEAALTIYSRDPLYRFTEQEARYLADAILGARAALAAAAAPAPLTTEERCRRFNETTGVHGYWSERGATGANLHPDRCVCQGRDTTPHKHYDEPPFRCARCVACNGYAPAVGAAAAPAGKCTCAASYDPPRSPGGCPVHDAAAPASLIDPDEQHRCACGAYSLDPREHHSPCPLAAVPADPQETRE